MDKREDTGLLTRTELTEPMDNEIDLIELFYYLKSKLLILIAAVLIGGLVSGCLTAFLIKPKYQATSYLYMVSASSDSMIDLSDLSIGNSIAQDYQQLMIRKPILDNVIDSVEGVSVIGSSKDSDILVLDNESDLAKYINLSIVDQSRVLKVNVITTDPVLSRDIANALADQAVEYIPTVTQSPAPTIAEYAVVPTEKHSPGLTRNTLIGSLLLLLLTIIYFTIQHILDDTVKSADDLEKYFGIVALSEIPDSFINYGNSTYADKKH